MIMAESAAYDNIHQLTSMANNLATFVQQAVIVGTAAHEVERGLETSAGNGMASDRSLFPGVAYSSNLHGNSLRSGMPVRPF